MAQSTIQGTARYTKQLRGWLSYAFARYAQHFSITRTQLIPFSSEVFVIVSLTLFLPICLEQFARDNGFLLPDRTKPCSSLEITPAAETRCVVKIGWLWIDSASFR
jgi:MFS transporter, UMF1 family